jgi:hypothetical protein
MCLIHNLIRDTQKEILWRTMLRTRKLPSSTISGSLYVGVEHLVDFMKRSIPGFLTISTVRSLFLFNQRPAPDTSSDKVNNVL